MIALLREPTVQEFYYPKTVHAGRVRLRERLAAEDPKARLRAIRLLSQLGDLQDISLLTDLVLLCDCDEAQSEERSAILSAMDEISRRPVT